MAALYSDGAGCSVLFPAVFCFDADYLYFYRQDNWRRRGHAAYCWA